MKNSFFLSFFGKTPAPLDHCRASDVGEPHSAGARASLVGRPRDLELLFLGRPPEKKNKYSRCAAGYTCIASFGGKKNYWEMVSWAAVSRLGLRC